MTWRLIRTAVKVPESLEWNNKQTMMKLFINQIWDIFRKKTQLLHGTKS